MQILADSTEGIQTKRKQKKQKVANVLIFTLARSFPTNVNEGDLKCPNAEEED